MKHTIYNFLVHFSNVKSGLLLIPIEYCYGESINWWTGKNMPKGFSEALIQAKKKVANSEPLGFTVEEMLNPAQNNVEKSQPKNK